MKAYIAERTTRQRRAYLSRTLPADVERRAAERYDLVRNPADTVLGTQELARNAKGSDYILTTAMQPISRAIMQELGTTLKAIGTLSVGYNHIDLEAARELGIAVFYSPGVLSDACADLAVMLLLNAARRGHEAEAMVRSGAWPGYGLTQLLGIGLKGRRAGILGMGRIGQETAKRLRGFGVEIHYHNRRQLSPEQEQGATYHATAESLLQVSDFLLLLTPGSPEMAGFLNRDRIGLLPQNAIVMNLSRGDVVDDDALIASLRSGRLFAAGLDVYRNEPHLDPRYRELTNVFLTPHIASATVESRNAMGFLVLDGLQAFEEGRTAENQLC